MAPSLSSHAPRTARRLLRAGGVGAEMIMPTTPHTADLHRADSRLRPRWFAHTLSAYGLKRLLRLARAKGRPFDLVFTPLPGVRGDEAWRQRGGARLVRVADDGRGGFECAAMVVAEGGAAAPCSAAELALASPAAPDWRHWSWWATYALQPQPNPIVPPLLEEMHCVNMG